MESNQPIYVICPNRNFAVGGIKQLYKLVDVLNDIGYSAYIIHGKKNFRVTWFENQTPIKYFPSFFALLRKERRKNKSKFPLFLKQLFLGYKMPEKNSIIVFPEVYGPNIHKLAPENKIVIFNQNCYFTFNLFDRVQKDSPYESSNLLGCIVVSDDSQKYLQHAFPNLNVARINLALSDVFKYSGSKKKKIAFMPRKLPEDFNQVHQIVSKRPDFKDWEFVAIENMPELEVAQILKESAIFLSFNHREGFGLPPVEAMACGCYVIGYTGNGGNEYFDDRFNSIISDRDITQFAVELEHIVKTYNNDPNVIIQKGYLASKFALETYNKTNERKDLSIAWKSLLSN